MKHKCFKLTVLIVFLMFTIALFVPVSAASASITVGLKTPDDNAPMQGVELHLYHVADVRIDETTVAFDYTTSYLDCHMDLGDLQDASLPKHLLYYSQQNAISYLSQCTDDDGCVKFNNLVPGVYLIAPSECRMGKYALTPFVVCVPGYDKQNNSWQYDVDASSKIGIVTDDTTTTYLSVTKKWETSGRHPDSITVVLLRDSKRYETVTLSAANDWHYRWDGLSKNHIWDAVEENMPDDFTVSYVDSSNTVTIINSSDVPPPPDTPTKPQDELEQTGQLNWPVPILVTVGLIVFGFGWAVINLDKSESE